MSRYLERIADHTTIVGEAVGLHCHWRKNKPAIAAKFKHVLKNSLLQFLAHNSRLVSQYSALELFLNWATYGVGYWNILINGIKYYVFF